MLAVLDAPGDLEEEPAHAGPLGAQLDHVVAEGRPAAAELGVSASGLVYAEEVTLFDLDEIDEVLETNAEDFVKSYIQKGGE